MKSFPHLLWVAVIVVVLNFLTYIISTNSFDTKLQANLTAATQAAQATCLVETQKALSAYTDKMNTVFIERQVPLQVSNGDLTRRVDNAESLILDHEDRITNIETKRGK